MHPALKYMNISVFLMIISVKAYSHNEQGCLTWEIRRNRLILTCRLTTLSKQVFFIDNHEQEYIRCTLKEKINSCISRHASQSIFVNSSINTITLTIRKIDESNVDGKWKCKQGKNAYETEVSAAKGIISATDIHLNGEILNTGTAQKVKLKCYSCREPRHNYAEFHINGTSAHGISYNKAIDKCIHQYGECKSHVCSCHRSGNEFIRIFNITNFFGTYYSCEMRFNDIDKESIFSMERTVYVNDTVFYNAPEIKLIKPPSKGNDKKIRTKDTEIELIKPPSRGNDKKVETEHTDNLNDNEITIVMAWIGTGFSLLVVLAFLALIIYGVWRTTIQKAKAGETTTSGNSLYAKVADTIFTGNEICQMSSKTTMSKTIPHDSATETQFSEHKLLEKAKETNEHDAMNTMTDDIPWKDSKPHDKALETTTIQGKSCNIAGDNTMNENGQQNKAKVTEKALYSPCDTDVNDKFTDVLQHHKIKESKMAVVGQNIETKAKTIQKKQNKMSRKDDDDQQERALEAEDTLGGKEHDNDMGFILPEDSSQSEKYEDQTYTSLGEMKEFSSTLGTEDKAEETTTSGNCSYAKVADTIFTGNEIFQKSAKTTMSKTIPHDNATETQVSEHKLLEKAKETNEHDAMNTVTEDIPSKDSKPHDKALETTTIQGKSCDIAGENTMNENGQQNKAKVTEKALYSPCDTDVNDKFTDVLQHHKIKESKMAVVEQNVETKAETIQKKQNKMSRKDEQQERALEADDILGGKQHDNEMGFILPEGTETEGNQNGVSNLCQPCKKISISAPACYWCQDCKESVCECCKESHSKNHNFTKISSPLVPIVISKRCGDHPDRPYEFFCNNHNNLCCVECKFIKHSRCVETKGIAIASKGFKSSKDIDDYKILLKKKSNSFGNLKYFLEKAKKYVQQYTSFIKSEITNSYLHFIEETQFEHFKVLFGDHLKADKNKCLSKLQKQILVVSQCETYINTIEANFDSIMEDFPEEDLFLMVHISLKFLESTLKEVVRDSESIKFVFNPILIGGKKVGLNIRENKRVLPENLASLLSRPKQTENRPENAFGYL